MACARFNRLYPTSDTVGFPVVNPTYNLQTLLAKEIGGDVPPERLYKGGIL